MTEKPQFFEGDRVVIPVMAIVVDGEPDEDGDLRLMSEDGYLFYAKPDQILGKPEDKHLDIWAPIVRARREREDAEQQQGSDSGVEAGSAAQAS